MILPATDPFARRCLRAGGGMPRVLIVPVALVLAMQAIAASITNGGSRRVDHQAAPGDRHGAKQ